LLPQGFATILSRRARSPLHSPDVAADPSRQMPLPTGVATLAPSCAPEDLTVPLRSGGLPTLNQVNLKRQRLGA